MQAPDFGGGTTLSRATTLAYRCIGSSMKSLILEAIHKKLLYYIQIKRIFR